MFTNKREIPFIIINHRQVWVSPLISCCLDEFIHPNLIKITKPIQNSSQKNVTYLMEALQRHEVEKFCIDNKRTFFGYSFDGASPWPESFIVLVRGFSTGRPVSIAQIIMYEYIRNCHHSLPGIIDKNRQSWKFSTLNLYNYLLTILGLSCFQSPCIYPQHDIYNNYSFYKGRVKNIILL